MCRSKVGDAVMKIVVNNKDISQVVGKIVWSGDIKQVARKLEFTVAYSRHDYYFNQLNLATPIGSKVELVNDDGTTIFEGIIFDINESSAAKETHYLAFDYLFYLLKSDISKVFHDTAENIANQVCQLLGVKAGNMIYTGTKVYLPCLPENAYKAIMIAYTKASLKTQKKYMPVITDKDCVAVIEKGTASGVILDSNYNLIDIHKKVSLQNLINKVLVLNKTGKVTQTLETKSTAHYGVIQKTAENMDEAKATLHGVDKSLSVSALSDVRAKAGYSLIVKESGMTAIFHIDSDTHTFENGKSTMALSLNLENIMDKQESKE